MKITLRQEFKNGRWEFTVGKVENPKLSNCCGSKMTETDSTGLGKCLECGEGCSEADLEEQFLSQLGRDEDEQERAENEKAEVMLAMSMGANPLKY